MKSLVVAIFLFMRVLSSAIGEILIPATKVPRLLGIWRSPTVALGLQMVIFWLYKDSNDEDTTENGSYRPTEIRGTRETPV
jgi:hypothetical protein